MKKEKIFWVSILTISCLLLGCRGEAGAEKQVTKLIWQSDQNFGKREAYFNQVLKEKNLPYEVEFIGGDETLEGEAADLRDISWDLTHTYDATEEILKGDFIVLDKYLDSKEGKVIKNSLPENVWEAYQVDGKQYAVLHMGFMPGKIVYIWDKELAEKYDVHPENWSENIWEYENELEKISRGEKERDSFVVIEGLRIYSEYLKGMTKPLGICYPLVVQETEENPKASLLYETPEYKEYLTGVQKLYDAGIYNPQIEENTDLNVTSFLTIDTDFWTEDAYLAWEKDDFWDTHEKKEIWREFLWRQSTCAFETGITSLSKHPDEAFSFLCRLYEDADLTNALMWGEENKDYEVIGKTAEKPVSGGYIPPLYAGNNLIAYAEVIQDENKAKVYPDLIRECEDSKLKGFEFSGKECETGLQALFETENEIREKSGAEILNETDLIIKKCKDAGVDHIIAEWNKQYAAWRALQ